MGKHCVQAGPHVLFLSPDYYRSVCSAVNVFRLGCKGCFDNCQYALYSGKLAPIVELLIHQLGVSNILRFQKNVVLMILFYSF